MAGSQDRLWKELRVNTSLAFSKAHLKTSMLVVLNPGCKLKSHERILEGLMLIAHKEKFI